MRKLLRRLFRSLSVWVHGVFRLDLPNRSEEYDRVIREARTVPLSELFPNDKQRQDVNTFIAESRSIWDGDEHQNRKTHDG